MLNTRVKGSLDVVASVAMVLAAGSILWAFFRAPSPSARPRPAVPTAPLSLDGAPILGSRQAPLAIVEFSDFQCPFCGRFSSTILPDLKKRYIDTGEVRLAFRHLPLPIHQHALAAARAADCAAQRGAFWPAHDQLFAAPALNDAAIHDAAAAAGVTDAQISACLAGGASQVDRDLALATSLKISSTPTFLVGVVEADGQMRVTAVLEGARPVDQFDDAIRGARNNAATAAGMQANRKYFKYASFGILLERFMVVGRPARLQAWDCFSGGFESPNYFTFWVPLGKPCDASVPSSSSRLHGPLPSRLNGDRG